MDQLPCIKDRCLKFPVCKNKSSVRCDILELFYNTNKINAGKPGTWVMIHSIMPELKAIECQPQLNNHLRILYKQTIMCPYIQEDE